MDASLNILRQWPTGCLSAEQYVRMEMFVHYVPYRRINSAGRTTSRASRAGSAYAEGVDADEYTTDQRNHGYVGKTDQNIIRAIVSGKRDPQKLAKLRTCRIVGSNLGW